MNFDTAVECSHELSCLIALIVRFLTGRFIYEYSSDDRTYIHQANAFDFLDEENLWFEIRDCNGIKQNQVKEILNRILSKKKKHTHTRIFSKVFTPKCFFKVFPIFEEQNWIFFYFWLDTAMNSVLSLLL